MLPSGKLPELRALLLEKLGQHMEALRYDQMSNHHKPQMTDNRIATFLVLHGSINNFETKNQLCGLLGPVLDATAVQ